MKKSLTFAFLFFVSYCGLYSQYFQKEQISIGTNIGVLEHGAFYGLSGEYGLTKNIGLGLDLGYYQFNEDFGTAIPMYSYDIPESVFKINYKAYNFYLTGSYHFFPESKFDPFVRLGMGYINYGFGVSINDKDSSIFGFSAAFPSVFSTKIEAGINYHINDVLSFKTTVGYPYYFNTGFNINFNRPELASLDTAHSAATDKYSMYFGYYLGGNVSSIINVPNYKSFTPSGNFPDLGFSLYLPFGNESSVGFLLNAGYSQTSYSTHPSDNKTDTNTIKETYEFITVQPTLNLGGFLLGVKIGLPKSAKAENMIDQNQAIIQSKDERGTYYTTTSKDLINTQFDVVLGGSFTLANFDSGKLKLNLQASYALVPLYKDDSKYLIGYDQKVTQVTNNGKTEDVISYVKNSSNNPTPVAISLGISYLFRIGF